MRPTQALRLSLISTAMLFAPVSLIHAQSFIDDFSTDLVSRPNYSIFIKNVANEETVLTFNGTELDVAIQHSDPSNLDERAMFEVKPITRSDLITSTGTFKGERPDIGALRFEVEGNFFNTIQDGGPSAETREGDVEIDIIINLAANPADDYASYCIFERNSEDSGETFNGAEENCARFNIAVELDTLYAITAGIDRSTNQIFAQLNDERIVVDYTGAFYEPMRENSHFTRFRVRDGAQSGDFSFSSINFDSEMVSLDEIANPSPYKQDDFDTYDDDPTRSKEILDSRLKLSASVANAGENNESLLRFRENGQFIGGDITYSSESTKGDYSEGFQSIRLSGLLYNDVSDDVDGDNTGAVFAALSLIENANTELVGEYCLIRSNDANFDSTIDLADGMADNRCPTFDLTVTPDSTYSASIELDVAAKRVTYNLGGEEKVVDITSDIFIRQDDTLRAQARIGFGATGTVVGFVDNLTNSRDLFNSGSSTDSDGSSSNSSGGGCSIGSSGATTGLLVPLATLSFLILMQRRSRTRKYKAK